MQGFSKAPINLPVQLDFEPIASGNETNLTNKAKVLVHLNPKFKNYKIIVDVEPFCNPILNNGSHFLLTKDKPTKELKNLPIMDVLCNDENVKF